MAPKKLLAVKPGQKRSLMDYMEEEVPTPKSKAKVAPAKKAKEVDETLQSTSEEKNTDGLLESDALEKALEEGMEEEADGEGKTEQSEEEEKEGEEHQRPPARRVTSQSSQGSAGRKVKVKAEKPEPEEQRKMLAKLHYMAKTGKPEALAEYRAKDVEGKRAWFHEVYKMDPNLPKYSNVIRTKAHFRTFSFLLLQD